MKKRSSTSTSQIELNNGVKIVFKQLVPDVQNVRLSRPISLRKE